MSGGSKPGVPSAFHGMFMNRLGGDGVWEVAKPSSARLSAMSVGYGQVPGAGQQMNCPRIGAVSEFRGLTYSRVTSSCPWFLRTNTAAIVLGPSRRCRTRPRARLRKRALPEGRTAVWRQWNDGTPAFALSAPRHGYHPESPETVPPGIPAFARAECGGPSRPCGRFAPALQGGPDASMPHSAQVRIMFGCCDHSAYQARNSANCASA